MKKVMLFLSILAQVVASMSMHNDIVQMEPNDESANQELIDSFNKQKNSRQQGPTQEQREALKMAGQTVEDLPNIEARTTAKNTEQWVKDQLASSEPDHEALQELVNDNKFTVDESRGLDLEHVLKHNRAMNNLSDYIDAHKQGNKAKMDMLKKGASGTSHVSSVLDQNTQKISQFVSNNNVDRDLDEKRIPADDLKKAVTSELSSSKPNYQFLKDFIEANKYGTNSGMNLSGPDVRSHNSYMEALKNHVDAVQKQTENIFTDKGKAKLSNLSRDASLQEISDNKFSDEDMQEFDAAQKRVALEHNQEIDMEIPQMIKARLADVKGFSELPVGDQERLVNILHEIYQTDPHVFEMEPNNVDLLQLRRILIDKNMLATGVPQSVFEFLKNQYESSVYKKILLAVGITSVVIGGIIALVLTVIKKDKRGTVVASKIKKTKTTSSKKNAVSSAKDSGSKLSPLKKSPKTAEKSSKKSAVVASHKEDQATMEQAFKKSQQTYVPHHHSAIAPTGITTGFMHMNSLGGSAYA